MLLTRVSKMERPLLGVFAWPQRRLLRRIELQPGVTYVFGRAPELARTHHRVLENRALGYVPLDGGARPRVGRVHGALIVKNSGVDAVDLHPAPGLRLQRWASAAPTVLTSAPVTLPAFSCLWTPAPDVEGIDSYQLAVVSPQAMRHTERLRQQAVIANGNMRMEEEGSDSVLAGDPSPTPKQLEAIIVRYGGQLSFPAPEDSVEAQGSDRAMDKRLDQLQVKVSRFAGWSMGRTAAIAYLADGGFLHPAMVDRAARALGVDLGFGWISDAAPERAAS